MKISDMFPSKYLKATDIPPGRDVALQIDEVRMEAMDQSKDEKPVLYFIGKQKGLVLNKINGEITLGNAYGGDCDAWHGRPVVLFASTTMFQGKNVPCIRLRVPNAPRQEMPNAADPAAFDGDIPF